MDQEGKAEKTEETRVQQSKETKPEQCFDTLDTKTKWKTGKERQENKKNEQIETPFDDAKIDKGAAKQIIIMSN